MAKRINIKDLNGRHLQDFAECISFFTYNKFTKTAQVIGGLNTYLNTLNRSYETLKRAKNPLGCIHFIRMAADVCCYAYGLLMAIDDKHRRGYVDHILKGKEIRQFDSGLRYKDEDGVEKKQKYTTTFLAEQISLTLMPDFNDVYTLSNQYIHPSSFYCRELDWYKDIDTPRDIRYLDQVDVVAAEMDTSVATKFYRLMGDLNVLYYKILRGIMGRYEEEYLLPRMQQFPLILDIEFGIEDLPNGTKGRCVDFTTNGQTIWDLLVRYEKDPQGVLDMVRSLYKAGGLNSEEIVRLNVTTETLKNSAAYKSKLEELAKVGGLQDVGIKHHLSWEDFVNVKPLYLDWLFPGVKVVVHKAGSTK